MWCSSCGRNVRTALEDTLICCRECGKVIKEDNFQLSLPSLRLQEGRENNKAYLLIDFSEYLKINVYVLGAVFLQLCTLLRLVEHLFVQKPVDPSLFMYKFTNGLLRSTYLPGTIYKQVENPAGYMVQHYTYQLFHMVSNVPSLIFVLDQTQFGDDIDFSPLHTLSFQV